MSDEEPLHDRSIARCLGNGGGLPLPLWERVGVRGHGLSIERNPSPGSHLRCDPTSPTRGEVAPRMLNDFNSTNITLKSGGHALVPPDKGALLLQRLLQLFWRNVARNRIA